MTHAECWTPEARMLVDLASERKEFQDFANKMGLTEDERELAFTRMHLNQGMNYAKHICDRMGMSPDERAKLL